MTFRIKSITYWRKGDKLDIIIENDSIEFKTSKRIELDRSDINYLQTFLANIDKKEQSIEDLK